MGERAALGVLSRETNRDALLEQGGERERLGLTPVDPTLGDRLSPSLELLCELRVHLEAFGNAQELVVQLDQALRRHRGEDGIARVARDALLAWGLGLQERRAQVVVRLAQRVDRLLEELARLFLRQHARLDEASRVRLPHRLLALDLLRHQRLRVRGLVLLVVPEAPVPDEVYDEVVAELLPVGERKPDRRQRSLGIVGVHMDDWHVEAFREVARVAGRAPLGWVGREPDLVVGDDVERPAGGVAVDRVEVERLGDDALASERRVAVDEDRERDRRVVDAAGARPIRLLRPRMALDDGVDRLQVARVRGEGHLDVAGAGLPRLGGGEVVLDIARSALRIGDEGVDGALALELAQDRGVRAADRVREHVEPPAMCDPDHDLVRAPGGSKLDREVQHRDERVEALDGELLLPDERAPQVRLEGLDLRESEEESPLLFGRERLAEATRTRSPAAATRSA